MFMTLFVALCSVAVGVIMMVLIFHRDYSDDIFQRIACSLIAISAFARTIQLVAPDPNSIFNATMVPGLSNVGVLLWVGLAMFFSSHCYRFLRRCKRKDDTWYDVDSTLMLKRRGHYR